MKKIMMMLIATVMAIGMASCSASVDEMDEVLTRASVENEFSVLNYTMTRGASVSNETSSNEEKLVCKVLPGGQLMLTHKNVIFDEGTNVKFTSRLEGNRMIVTETGDYGKSGNYGYYTLVAKVGTLQDGNYVVVVERNDHVREEFSLTYDSSKASSQQ
jgi:hypothetical protein